jgi:hypothetical protein
MKMTNSKIWEHLESQTPFKFVSRHIANPAGFDGASEKYRFCSNAAGSISLDLLRNPGSMEDSITNSLHHMHAPPRLPGNRRK